MVGSDCSFIRFCRRLTNTPATRGRSSARPVSFSTIEASVTISAGVFTGTSALRRCQIWFSTSRCLARIRLRICWRVAPRSNL